MRSTGEHEVKVREESPHLLLVRAPSERVPYLKGNLLKIFRATHTPENRETSLGVLNFQMSH